MKHTFSWMVVLALHLGVVLLVAAQQPGRMHGEGMMGGKGMMGDKRPMGRGPDSSQETEGVASAYTKLCASCHGVTGKADGPAAMVLNPRPKDFTDCKVMAHESDKMLFEIIKIGGQAAGHSPLMPPWGGSLTDDQISEMVSYIRSFCIK